MPFRPSSTPPPVKFDPVCGILNKDDGSEMMYHGMFMNVVDDQGNEFFTFCLITSDRELYTSESEDLEKLKARPRVVPNPEAWIFENRWSVKGIVSYLNGIDPNPPPDSVLDMLMNTYKGYLELRRKMDYMLLSLWTIGTYMQPIWYSYPYLLIIGPMRSGKSKILELLEQTAYNPIKAESITESAMFRTIDALAPTILIDESDFTDPDKNSAIQRLLLVGYKKGNKALRSERTKSEKIVARAYLTFSPKAIVAPRGVQEMIYDRCIVIQMLRGRDPKIVNNWPRPDDPKWQDLRDHLYHFSLTKWKEVREAYESISGEEVGLSSRDLELWKPMLSIAKVFGVYDEVLDYARGKTEEKNRELLTEMNEVKLLRCLLHMAKEQVYDKYVSAATISEKLKDLYGDERWMKAQNIGRIMTHTLGFRNRPLKVIRRGVAVYKLDEEYLRDLAERYGIDPNRPLGEDEEEQ